MATIIRAVPHAAQCCNLCSCWAHNNNKLRWFYNLLVHYTHITVTACCMLQALLHTQSMWERLIPSKLVCSNNNNHITTQRTFYDVSCFIYVICSATWVPLSQASRAYNWLKLEICGYLSAIFVHTCAYLPISDGKSQVLSDCKCDCEWLANTH